MGVFHLIEMVEDGLDQAFLQIYLRLGVELLLGQQSMLKPPLQVIAPVPFGFLGPQSLLPPVRLITRRAAELALAVILERPITVLTVLHFTRPLAQHTMRFYRATTHIRKRDPVLPVA